MPLNTVSNFLSESVPVWIVSGIVLVGGYMYDKSLASGERLTAVETRTEMYEADVTEIKESIFRVESHLMGDE